MGNFYSRFAEIETESDHDDSENQSCKSMTGLRYRNCFVTSFTDIGEYVIEPKELMKCGKVSYCIMSPLEKTPTTGRLHRHYYVEFKDKMGYRAIKKIFRNKTINIRKRAGTSEQARGYCTPGYFSKRHQKLKSEYTVVDPHEQPQEEGRISKPGKRSDWETIYELVKDLSVPIREILDSFPKLAVRYEAHIRRSRARCRYEQNVGKKFNRTNIVRVGAAGTGKDFDVYEKYGAENVYELARDENGSIWWDGYEGQDVLLISDWKNTLTRARLLNIMGDRMVRVNVKGGTEWWVGHTVVITSNFPIETWYDYWDHTEYVDDALVSRLAAYEHYELEKDAEPCDRSILRPTRIKKPNWRLQRKKLLRKKLGGGSVLPPTPGRKFPEKISAEVKTDGVPKKTQDTTVERKTEVAAAKASGRDGRKNC